MEEQEIPYIVYTNVGNQECYFVELKGSTPQFSNDLEKARFLPKEDAIKLRDILNEKADMVFGVLKVNIVDQI